MSPTGCADCGGGGLLLPRGGRLLCRGCALEAERIEASSGVGFRERCVLEALGGAVPSLGSLATQQQLCPTTIAAPPDLRLVQLPDLAPPSLEEQTGEQLSLLEAP